MNHLLPLFPAVEKIIGELEHQNKLLRKITLTGKINALDVASTLFEFTDTTITAFERLKHELVEALLEENVKKSVNVLESKSKIAINILIRNLFERTADVGFLATDGVIVDFLTTEQVDPEAMRKRLIAYSKKYTVYNEIVVLDLEGNVRVNIHPENRPALGGDTIVAQALAEEGYVERYAYTELFPRQERTLVYAQKILKNHQPVGVLVLCFRLDDELERILGRLSTEQEEVGIASAAGSLVVTKKTDRADKMRYTDAAYELVAKRQLAVTSKTGGYQEYFGQDDWYGYALSVNMKTPEFKGKEGSSNERRLLNAKLNGVIDKANELVEDLGDVIINGELIASKRRVYVLGPILDNLRSVSYLLLDTIRNAVSNLEFLVNAALVNESVIASDLAIDIMDRNLYERANDCRWWALTPLFQNELAKEVPDAEALNDTLHYINALYTVYTNLFLFDRDGRIVAASNDRSVLGKRVPQGSLGGVLALSHEQQYTVGKFEPTPFYGDAPTYIYYAAVRSGGRCIGGIGIVFDSTVEFRAMLEDSFPAGKKGFSLFVDAELRVIATSGGPMAPMERCDIEIGPLNRRGGENRHGFVTYRGKHYIYSVAKSQGYREYKTEDNYRNDVYAVTMVEI